MPRLIVHPDRPDRREIALAAGSITIGRDQDDDLFILDQSLSRHHARIDVGEDGSAVLHDLGSTNGTFVGGSRVEHHPLSGDETFRCGGVRFRFVGARAGGQGTTPESSLDIHADLTHASFAQVLEGAGVAARAPAEERLRILLKVSQLLASPASLDEVLERVLDLALDILDIDRATLLLIDEETGELEPRVFKSRSDRAEGDAAYSSHVVEYVRRHSVAALFGDARADWRLGDAASVLAQSIRTSMAAPLKPKDQVRGVLYVDNLTTPERFTQEDLEFLSAFANQAAVAIENSRLHSELERQAVTRNNLLRFFPPATIEHLIEGEGVSLGAQKTEATALFCDISGFTSLSSALAPEELVALLNRYFPAMAEVVFRHGGTLEKYIGDALMAVWGAPLRRDDDPLRAVAAAAEMQRTVERLREAGDAAPFAVHIGLNTGPVAAGNIGSEEYLQYAVIGETTNLASRICDLAAPGEVLLSGATTAGLEGSEWSVEALAPAELKGRREPLEIFRLRWDSNRKAAAGI